MTSLAEFLQQRLETGGFSTEDALASFLPLVREVLEAHSAGLVAPLEGIGDLHVEGVRIWFEEARRAPQRGNLGDVRRLLQQDRAAVEVVTESRRTTDVDDGGARVVNLRIGDPDKPITRPVYLPRYTAWEHALGHHDPATDVFSLGMILASLACGLDFNDTDDLERFVANRLNLFAIAPDLHPVLARAITRMTDLDRHDRPQDLPALLSTLQNYREQSVDFEFDLARVAGYEKKNNRDKQHVVLTKLRERLFDITRRNRLLQFRATSQNVNLTHASVPLSFDIQNIRDDQILVWNDVLQKQFVVGKPVSLSKYLNFSEALYLPSVLDRIISEARRDQAEFGFAQLRLVACFLHWANLKEKPIEQYDSPLVLVPVRLIKKKGIRDTYHLEPLSTDAEINPVVRHLFKQLYAIDLPETIDLEATSLDTFHESLRQRIEASEAAVTLTKIDRPRIDLVHDKARRKLDQYRRRARLAGRGVRSYLELDYSYDPANFHPLGIKLFSSRVRPPSTHLREIIEEKPRPRTFVAPEPQPPVVEQQRTFYSLKEGGEENPYAWTFDLCSVTLANFRYRKMSLVRDYEDLLEQQPTNSAFEATFSLVPRPVNADERAAPPLEDRYDVVPCDPTQATAIGQAHAGKSYIIQGPPGTGKSQTITNLIADYVARGKRVLFVCEKRAAIDVVYARLRQCGLGDLCCLIHDSQTDKKAFVMDLKETYEGFLVSSERGNAGQDGRDQVLGGLKSALRPLERFDEVMRITPATVGIPVRQLLDRCIELRDALPNLSAIEAERLPDYAAWWRNRAQIDSYLAILLEFQPDGILANHPLRLLSPRLVDSEQPLALVTTATDRAASQLERLPALLEDSGIAGDEWDSVERLRALVDYAKSMHPVARLGHFALLDPNSEPAARFAADVQQLRDDRQALEQAQEGTTAWRHKIPAAELSAAIAQAENFESSFFSWLSPAWWRLRGSLHRAYDFRSHVIRPGWSHVLRALQTEYDAAARFQECRRSLTDQYGFGDDAEPQIDDIFRVRQAIQTLPDWLQRIHTQLLTSADDAARRLDSVVTADGPLKEVETELARIADDYETLPLERLRAALQDAIDALHELPDYLQCMTEIGRLPESLQTALRSLPLAPTQIEAAIAQRGVEDVFRRQRDTARFNSTARNRYARRLESLYDGWFEANAATVRQLVMHRFVENVRVSSLPAAQLSQEQKSFKKAYNRGRRELEHEFGKSMRYKAIRDLVAGDSGIVVKDLKPVWLMSPLSVSDTLPLDTDHVDVVIFDEASQITLEESIPSIFRARQVIVVGDQMQLPPTNFFAARRDEEEEDLLIEEGGELIQYELQSNSFLNHAAKNLASTMLGWHYRSRSESLISYSNWTFYQGRLLTVPEEELPRPDQTSIRAAAAEDGQSGAEELLSRSISFHQMEHGVYEKRRNRAEADYIAQMVRKLLSQRSGISIGIVAFSEAQQGEIEGALQRLAQDDREFRELLDVELEREDDGQFVGLLVKNLENIQGDERDAIILSVCYGPGPNGKMLMNFGPINNSGGEKRLNVAFSRAKRHMAVVSSIQYAAITNDYNDGANCLKNYLRYAEAVSAGNLDAAQRVLHGMSRWHEFEATDESAVADVVTEQLAEAIAQRGYLVDRSIGQSHFRCDLAVRTASDTQYRLGILVDNQRHYKQADLAEREMMRPKLLRNFGWRITHVLAKDWHEDSRAVLDIILRLLEGGDDDAIDDAGDDAEDNWEATTADAARDVEAVSPESIDALPESGENARPEPARDAGPTAEGGTRYFELVSDTSSKFWEVTLGGDCHSVRFGRIGTRGQSRTKQFLDEAAARRDHDRLIRSKLAKGYQEKPSGESGTS